MDKTKKGREMQMTMVISLKAWKMDAALNT